FTYRVADSEDALSNVATVALTVNPAIAPIAPIAPIAADDTVTTLEDSSVGGNVLANDRSGAGGALSVTLVSGPSHGARPFNPDGSFTYLPDANFNGLDSFTYRATDGGPSGSTAT